MSELQRNYIIKWLVVFGLIGLIVIGYLLGVDVLAWALLAVCGIVSLALIFGCVISFIGFISHKIFDFKCMGVLTKDEYDIFKYIMFTYGYDLLLAENCCEDSVAFSAYAKTALVIIKKCKPFYKNWIFPG